MITLRRGVPMVDVERSGVVESVHSGHLVILDSAGLPLAGIVRQLWDEQQVFATLKGLLPAHAEATCCH